MTIFDRPSLVSYRMPMMEEMSLSVLRYGVDGPLPVRRPLRADPDFLRASIGERTNAAHWEGTLDLLPFAIAVVDGELED